MSGHPFVSQSKHGVFFCGHNVTHSPLRNFDGSIKRKYRRFPRRIVPGDPRASYFDTTLFRISNAPKPGKTTGRLKRKNWRLSKANKEILRKVERERVKRAKKKIKMPVDLAGFPNYCGCRFTHRAKLFNNVNPAMSTRLGATKKEGNPLGGCPSIDGISKPYPGLRPCDQSEPKYLRPMLK